METITDADGKYSFAYVEVGEEYYVEFVYDGMTYKNNKILKFKLTESEKSDLSNINKPYIDKTRKLLKSIACYRKHIRKRHIQFKIQYNI